MISLKFSKNIFLCLIYLAILSKNNNFVQLKPYGKPGKKYPNLPHFYKLLYLQIKYESKIEKKAFYIFTISGRR